MKGIVAVVRGRVQGVGFRDFTARRAKALGLVGWVQNQLDGSVKLQAEGEPAALARLVADLREGPSMSRVTSVDADDRPATGEFPGFEVR